MSFLEFFFIIFLDDILLDLFPVGNHDLENMLMGIDFPNLLPPDPDDDEAMVEYAIALSLQQQDQQQQNVGFNCFLFANSLISSLCPKGPHMRCAENLTARVEFLLFRTKNRQLRFFPSMRPECRKEASQNSFACYSYRKRDSQRPSNKLRSKPRYHGRACALARNELSCPR